MHENRDFVVPVNILTPFAHALFSWAARHTTECLDISCYTVPYHATYVCVHSNMEEQFCQVL